MKQLITAVLLAALSTPALADGEAWENIRKGLYGEQFLLSGAGVIAIDAPYRTPIDARADLAAHVVAPDDTGIAEVAVILDENPMPVSAVFRFEEAVPRFFFDITMRVNGPTPMHVVARTTDGRHFVAETFVKTTGQGACAAPPGTDPELALKTLGEMQIELAGQIMVGTGAALDPLALNARMNKLDVDLDHPQHSGMQMDQITLLFTPMRYIETLDIDLDGAGFVEMTGSISLSENPRVGLSVPRSAQSVDVTMTDTDGTVSTARKKLAGY